MTHNVCGFVSGGDIRSKKCPPKQKPERIYELPNCYAPPLAQTRSCVPVPLFSQQACSPTLKPDTKFVSFYHQGVNN